MSGDERFAVRSVDDARTAITAGLTFLLSREPVGTAADRAETTALLRRMEAVHLAETRRFDTDQMFALDGAASV